MRVVQEHGKLLDATNCSRCNDPLVLRTVSHFTSEPICKGCMDAEAVIKARMINLGICVEAYRNCGYIPSPTNQLKKLNSAV